MPMHDLWPTENGMKASFLSSSPSFSNQRSGMNSSGLRKAFGSRWMVKFCVPAVVYN